MATEWRYLWTGRVTHALPTSPLYHRIVVAACGASPSLYDADWYGTGNQGEYEKVERLPRCKKCLALIGEPKGDPTDD